MRNKNLIFNPVFLICLVVLFLNDHFFKFYYTSWFTGKLSDIAGIILLPMLLTYLFPWLKQNSVFVTGLLFTFWKSPFSEGFITIYNTIAPIGIHRVVDYTDLLVLLLLPVPYLLIKKSRFIDDFSIKKLNPAVVLCPAILILMSTAPPKNFRYNRYSGNVIFEDFVIEVNKTKEEIMDEFKKRNIEIHKDTARIIDESTYLVLRTGKMNSKNLNNGEDVFKYNNDSLKALLNRKIQESNQYKIDEAEIGAGSRVRNIQLSIWGDSKSNKIVIHAMQVEKNLDSTPVDNRLKKIYKNLMLQKFKDL